MTASAVAMAAHVFDEHAVLHDLKHYLPAQAPLKDFVHHNTLHAFQGQDFYRALRNASGIFGYRTLLKLDEYRNLYKQNQINQCLLEHIIRERKGDEFELWKDRVLTDELAPFPAPRIGSLRAYWKRDRRMDLDSLVHPILFRILCSYLDQGIAIWSFPNAQDGFLNALKALEQHSLTSLFRTERARTLLLESELSISGLLKWLVADEALFARYLFDQQFAHPGWSGIVSVIEDQPDSLIDQRLISLNELIIFELLLEIDALDYHFPDGWLPLNGPDELKSDLLAEVPQTPLHEVLAIWQEAFEWTYYDPALTALQRQNPDKTRVEEKSFQGLFCIDDRIGSFRQHLELLDAHCETFGTPGFFGVEFYFQPEHGKSFTKVCPTPINPQYLIKEQGSLNKLQTEPHLHKQSHQLLGGLLITQTLGFWSAVKLGLNVFKPSLTPATASSFRHMDRLANLTIENRSKDDREHGLQIGFTVEEMAQRAEGLLKSIGLVSDFAPLVYTVGHGASSLNNPYYAAYDCGACSGRPGSVNARVISYILNHPEVRKILVTKGIAIPEQTRFVGALHDTTRDEIVFYDEAGLSLAQQEQHARNAVIFQEALDLNAKERARRFELTNSLQPPKQVHEAVKLRSVSLFEPRPELNHATNALCVVGRRELSRKVFLDRRAFLNSYDYRIDPNGDYLLNILRPAAPVTGGINLEYFFSRVDNQKLGAGSKLPHNVMGLIGVANGNDGDLRTGLPSQMIEIHNPIRMMIIVEHFPEVIADTIRRQQPTYEWFQNAWINLVAIHPETHQLYRLVSGQFVPYEPVTERIDKAVNLERLFETHMDNLPVYTLN